MKSVAARKKRRRFLMRRKRTIDPTLVVDYKNPDILKRFITDRGKIIPRRISGATAAQQRSITVAVKRARFLGLLPYSAAHRTERGFAGEMQMAAQTFSAGGFRGRAPRPDRDRAPRTDSAPRTESTPRTESAPKAESTPKSGES